MLDRLVMTLLKESNRPCGACDIAKTRLRTGPPAESGACKINRMFRDGMFSNADRGDEAVRFR